ncbi:GNAT family N-acetyltransferase [Sphingobacterium spiritivorum]|uniref:GNAT family N-acetyltransferase n=1 Tax=Sphingobacterium spiritivorum TaxID=258 RepID=UPI003DA4529B
MEIRIDEHIKLQQTSPEHAGGLLEAVDQNRDHLSRFLPWVGNMQKVTDFDQYIQYCIDLYDQQQEISFVILSDQTIVGRIGLHHINQQNKSAAIGYWLNRDMEGKGIISRSCRKIIDLAFNEFGLNRIEIKAAVENTKSQAIPQRLGFQREGILRQSELVNGIFLDLVIFSMLKDEWNYSVE